jgi:hypothetical protein
MLGCGLCEDPLCRCGSWYSVQGRNLLQLWRRRRWGQLLLCTVPRFLEHRQHALIVCHSCIHRKQMLNLNSYRASIGYVGKVSAFHLEGTWFESRPKKGYPQTIPLPSVRLRKLGRILKVVTNAAFHIPIVSTTCVNKVPINPIIQSRTNYYSPGNPGHVTICISVPRALCVTLLQMKLSNRLQIFKEFRNSHHQILSVTNLMTALILSLTERTLYIVVRGLL